MFFSASPSSPGKKPALTPVLDSQDRIIATLETSSNGLLILRRSDGGLLGTYDPRQDATRDALGRPVGRGNHLHALLFGTGSTSGKMSALFDSLTVERVMSAIALAMSAVALVRSMDKKPEAPPEPRIRRVK